MAGYVLIFIVLLWICLYSFSFGVYTWRNHNWFGGLVVILLSLTALLLPGYIMFRLM
jgi:hypothetical protein